MSVILEMKIMYEREYKSHYNKIITITLEKY